MNSEGIGMGLMISKGLVNMNGGEINVHSEGENLGSVFSFTMKMHLVESEIINETKLEWEKAKILQSGFSEEKLLRSYEFTQHKKTGRKKLI